MTGQSGPPTGDAMPISIGMGCPPFSDVPSLEIPSFRTPKRDRNCATMRVGRCFSSVNGVRPSERRASIRRPEVWFAGSKWAPISRAGIMGRNGSGTSLPRAIMEMAAPPLPSVFSGGDGPDGSPGLPSLSRSLEPPNHFRPRRTRTPSVMASPFLGRAHFLSALRMASISCAAQASGSGVGKTSAERYPE